LGRAKNPEDVSGSRLKRLAQRIDALAEKDAGSLLRTRQMEQLRRSAASEMYGICRNFVDSVNRLTANGGLKLDPPQFSDAGFQEDGANLIQISVRGRLLQVAFSATPELLSTEDFRVPYTLSGSVRAFNQELLDKEIIEEQLVFYTVEKDRRMWRYFDPRTYRTGAFDQDYLVSVIEQLI